jgi:hypothetical protein
MKYKPIFVTDRCFPLHTGLLLSSWKLSNVYATSGSIAGNVLFGTLVGLSGRYCSWDTETFWKRRPLSYNVVIGDKTNHKWPKQLSKECWKINLCFNLQTMRWYCSTLRKQTQLRGDPLNIQGHPGLFHTRCLICDQFSKQYFVDLYWRLYRHPPNPFYMRPVYGRPKCSKTVKTTPTQLYKPRKPHKVLCSAHGIVTDSYF